MALYLNRDENGRVVGVSDDGLPLGQFDFIDIFNYLIKKINELEDK